MVQSILPRTHASLSRLWPRVGCDGGACGNPFVPRNQVLRQPRALARSLRLIGPSRPDFCFGPTCGDGSAWLIQPWPGPRIPRGLGDGLPYPIPFPCRASMVGLDPDADVPCCRRRLSPPPPHRNTAVPGGPASSGGLPRRGAGRRPHGLGGSPPGWNATFAVISAAASWPTGWLRRSGGRPS